MHNEYPLKCYKLFSPLLNLFFKKPFKRKIHTPFSDCLNGVGAWILPVTVNL